MRERNPKKSFSAVAADTATAVQRRLILLRLSMNPLINTATQNNVRTVSEENVRRIVTQAHATKSKVRCDRQATALLSTVPLAPYVSPVAMNHSLGGSLPAPQRGEGLTQNQLHSPDSPIAQEQTQRQQHTITHPSTAPHAEHRLNLGHFGTAPTQNKVGGTKTLAKTSSQKKNPETHPDDFITITFDDSEKERLAQLCKSWESRHPAYRYTTSTWQQTQYRMLPLWVLDELELEEEFEARRDRNGWTYATASQYWSAMLAAAVAIGRAIPPALRAQGKVYSQLKKEEDPQRPTKPMSYHALSAICNGLETVTKTLLLTAFELGQRIGDTSKLRTSHITQLSDPATGLKLVCVGFRQGKTTRRRDPFTLHLLEGSPAGQAILQLAHSRRQEEYLFAPREQINVLLATLREEIKKEDAELTLLSIRRGGLQHMAMAGLSKSCLLHHSRHSSEALLDRYLEWGTWSLSAARERFADINWKEKLYQNSI